MTNSFSFFLISYLVFSYFFFFCISIHFLYSFLKIFYETVRGRKMWKAERTNRWRASADLSRRLFNLFIWRLSANFFPPPNTATVSIYAVEAFGYRMTSDSPPSLMSDGISWYKLVRRQSWSFKPEIPWHYTSIPPDIIFFAHTHTHKEWEK